MNNREEWTKLLLIGMMLIGIVSVALVSAGNLKKMGVYKESTTLSTYGEKVINYYHEKFDDVEVIPVKKIAKKRIDPNKKLAAVNDSKGEVAKTFTDVNGNVYHLNHKSGSKKKKSTVKKDKGSDND